MSLARDWARRAKTQPQYRSVWITAHVDGAGKLVLDSWTSPIPEHEARKFGYWVLRTFEGQ